MSLTSQAASQQQAPVHPSTAGEIWRGVLIGLIPLFLLGVLTAIAIALTDVIRQTFATSGFFAWQRASLITLTASLGLALLVYGISLVLILRQAATWQHNGLTIRSTSILWALLITACLVILPVVLVVVLPQMPAP